MTLRLDSKDVMVLDRALADYLRRLSDAPLSGWREQQERDDLAARVRGIQLRLSGRGRAPS